MRFCEIILVGAAVLAAAPIGCGRSPELRAPASATPSPAASNGTATGEMPTPSTAADVTLIEAGTEELDRVLAEHRNQVVLVDFWATWCIPCKQGLPKILGHAADYGPQGLAVITLSMDDESAREDVLAFLRSVSATIPNLISKWGAGTESMERFGVAGGLPYYRLYDRAGQMRYQFSGVPDAGPDVEQLDQLTVRMEQLLDE